MEKLQLAITLADGRTLQGQPRPEDEPRLAELLGDRSTIAFASNEADLEGHSMSGDVLVDVEGHAVTIRFPNAGDAAALRKALAVGAVTATLIGAGAIAALQPPAVPNANVVPAPAPENVISVPAPALRAQEAEMLREQQLTIQAAPVVDADNPAVPAPALRADRASQQEGQQVQTAPILDVDNPAVPAQALRAQQAEMAQQGQGRQIQGAPVLDVDNPAVPDQALRADE